MIHTTEAGFTSFLAESGISLSPKALGIGSQLSSDHHHYRIVTVHFQEDEPEVNQQNVLNALFALESNWLLFPRYGSVCELLSMPELEASTAVVLSNKSVEKLVPFLVALQSTLRVIEFDPYLISASGQILAAWDHHVFAEGFRVKFANIELSSRFINGLNELGAEFKLFTANA